MNKARRALIDLIYQIIPPSVSGVVVSVDEQEMTCEVKPDDGSENYQDVRLTAATDENEFGVISIPAVDSKVLISPLMNNDHAYFVSRFSKVKKWSLKTDSNRFIEIVPENGGKININGSDFGGIPKRAAIESVVDDLVQQIAAALTAVGVGPAANGPGAAASFTSAIAPLVATFKNSLQNPNVKHG